MELPSILIGSGEDVASVMAELWAATHQKSPPDLVVLLCRDAQTLKTRLHRTLCGVPILFVTANDFSHEALKKFEVELINAPPGTSCRPKIVSRTERQSAAPAEDAAALIDGHRLIGESPAILEIKSCIQRIAHTDTNVLITGETGTGKELIAELVRKNSKRRQHGYICINCAAIPDSLLESELFGYERGAFTGAQTACGGKLEGAQGGTVFFDEIGDMSLYAQAKILRLIETRELQRLGAKRPTRADFRIIAATNRDLDSPASAAHFRRDLYFRLNVARIHIPPLRERRLDIPLLLAHCIEEFSHQFGRYVEGIGAESMRALLHYDWPGNVRELRNMVEALFVNLPAGETRLHLPDRMRRHIGDCAAAPSEQELLLAALWATDWNKSKAARHLQWSRMTLYRKMVKYRMDGEERKKPPQRARPEQERSADNAGG